MNIREWMNNNSSVALVVTIVAVTAALVVIWQTLGSSEAGAQAVYHYDLDAGAVFVAPATTIPPTETPAGGTNGVRIGILGCGECPQDDFTGMSIEEIEEAGAFVAYFERYTDEAKTVLDEARAGASQAMEDPDFEERVHEAESTGRVVRQPQDQQWITQTSERGLWITDGAPAERCAGTVPRTCLP